MFIAASLEDIAKHFDSMAQRLKSSSTTQKVYKSRETLARAHTYKECAEFLRHVKIEKGNNDLPEKKISEEN